MAIKKKKRESLKIFDCILIFLIVTILPIIVYTVTFELPYEQQLVFLNTDFIDLFMLAKQKLLLVVALLIIFNAILSLITKGDDKFQVFSFLKKNIKNPLTIGIALMSFGLIISFIFSDYKATVLLGTTERYESIFVYFAYLIIFLFTLSFLKSRKAFEYLFTCFLISGFIIAFIGILQYYGIHLIDYQFFSEFIASEYYSDLTFSYNDTVYSTLYNANLAGLYAVMMIPLLAAIALVSKSTVKKVFSIIILAMMFMLLIFSDSQASYGTLIFLAGISVLIFIIYFLAKNKMTLYVGVPVLMISILVLGIGTFMFIKSRTVDEFAPTDIVNLDTTENNFYMENANGDILQVEFLPDGSYNIYCNGELLSSNDYTTLDEYSLDTMGKFEPIAIDEKNEDGILYLVITYQSYELMVKDTDGQATVLNSYSEFAPLPEVESALFEEHQQFATMRGYIWSKSIPLFFEYFFVGSGAGTYPMIFPQEDVEGKTVYYKNPYIVVDKPHNLYFMYSITNSIFYLIGFLMLAFTALVVGCKKIFTSSKINKDLIINLLIGLSIVAFMFNSMTTDSCIPITALFYIILAAAIKFVKIDDFEI